MICLICKKTHLLVAPEECRFKMAVRAGCISALGAIAICTIEETTLLNDAWLNWKVFRYAIPEEKKP